MLALLIYPVTRAHIKVLVIEVSLMQCVVGLGARAFDFSDGNYLIDVD